MLLPLFLLILFSFFYKEPTFCIFFPPHGIEEEFNQILTFLR